MNLDAYKEAHDIAVAHVEACFAAAFDEDPEIEDPSSAPYCGCTVCIVRETIYAAYPKLREHILANDQEEE